VWALAATAATLEKIGLEVRHLARTEVREVQESFAAGQKGSSAMPHKRNPVIAERVCGLARLVRANLQAALENVALWHERDISHSSVERVILPDSSIAVDYMLHLCVGLVGGLLVFPGRMLANLEATGGLVYSQAVLLSLVDAGLSRDDAYGIVQRAAGRIWESGGSFEEAVGMEGGDRVSAAQLHALFDPVPYVRHLDGVFARLEKLQVDVSEASSEGSG
jgi:adenylosuccinate lyase